MCFIRRPAFIFGMLLNFYIFSIPIEGIPAFVVLVKILLFIFIQVLLGLLTRCPKCSNWIAYNPHAAFGKHNALLPFYHRYCKNCGQNLDKCEIEQDEITNSRLKK